MKQYGELITNTALFGLSTVGVKLISFLLVPLYTAVLSSDLMGTVEIISTTMSVLVPILTLGLSTGIMRFSLDKDVDRRSILGCTVAVWLAGNVLLICVYPIVSSIELVAKYTTYIYGIYLFNSFDVLIAQYVRGNERLKVFALSGVIKTLTLGVANVVLLLGFELGAEGYLISIILSHITSVGFLVIAGVDKRVLLRIKCEREVLKKLIKFSVPFIPNSVSWWLNNASARYIIIIMFGASAAGIYSVANRIPAILITATGVFNLAWQISAVKKYNEETSYQYYKELFRLYNSLLSIVCTVLIFASPLIANVLFVNEYYDGWKYVPFILVAMMMGSLANFYDAIIISTKKTGTIFWATMIGAIVNIVLGIALMNFIGVIGAAIASMISYSTIFYIRVITARKILEQSLMQYRTNILFLILVVQAFIQSFGSMYINMISFTMTLIVGIITHQELIQIIKIVMPITLKGSK